MKAGLVFPVVAESLLGSAGQYLMLVLILLAVMSTGSGEVIAISSIIIYDIYQAYIQPYRSFIACSRVFHFRQIAGKICLPRQCRIIENRCFFF